MLIGQDLNRSASFLTSSAPALFLLPQPSKTYPMTRFFLPMLVFVVTALPIDGGRLQEDSIEGTWKLVSAEYFVIPTEDATGSRWTFHGNRLSGATQAQVTLYRDSMPCRIDLVPLGGPERGTTFRGIYTIQGDTLKLCLSCVPGGKGERPLEFVTHYAEGDDVCLWVLKRLKP
jgi:uncharacterized protein (TIGR03067 family)